jgi:HD-like signal output (HDOD) protein
VAIDGYGRFMEAVPELQLEGSGGTPAVTLRKFPGGASIDAFYREVGGAGEAAVELLSSIIEGPSLVEETPPMRDFLDAVESHGSLPAPGAIFRQVEAAAEEGDARTMASVIQPDPVISASLINSANAARFAAAGKTASVPAAVTRLGTGFVRRVVFVAEMMSRYKKGVCPGFDYQGFWMNGIATGAAMRALLDAHEIPARFADDAFTTGLVSGIGWLAVAETFPALMEKYLTRCKGADPITKAKAQQEIFPCPIRQVSERYLQRFEFPDAVHAAVAGRTDVDRVWYDCLAHAIRVAQGLAPFECLAVPTNIPVPEPCREEWQRWQGFLSALQ